MVIAASVGESLCVGVGVGVSTSEGMKAGAAHFVGVVLLGVVVAAIVVLMSLGG